MSFGINDLEGERAPIFLETEGASLRSLRPFPHTRAPVEREERTKNEMSLQIFFGVSGVSPRPSRTAAAIACPEQG